jgi:curved DNA-binding protein
MCTLSLSSAGRVVSREIEPLDTPDYYEFLQISPSAEPETIHRVYRFLASRYHPDNQETGDAGSFFLLQQAYEVLSNPERRAAYDATRQNTQPAPLSTSIDFMDAMEGELNRRLAVLAVLYFQRRTDPYRPEVLFLDVEKRLGFPRDYLEFTSWYLRTKGYITRGDNAALAITADGVDFVEKQRANLPVLQKLLTDQTRFEPETQLSSSTGVNKSESVEMKSAPPQANCRLEWGTIDTD